MFYIDYAATILQPLPDCIAASRRQYDRTEVQITNCVSRIAAILWQKKGVNFFF